MGILNDIDKIGDSIQSSHDLYLTFQKIKKNIGMGIFAIGKLLYIFKSNGLWAGYAESWNEFIASEGFTAQRASMLLAVYEKYCIELSLPEKTLEEIATRDYTILYDLKDVISKDNLDEGIGVITTNGRQDARKWKREQRGEEVFRYSAIDKVVGMFFKLDYDERTEAYRQIKKGFEHA